MFRKGILLLLACVILLQASVTSADGIVMKPLSISNSFVFSKIEGKLTIAENEHLALHYDFDENILSISDKSNQYIWTNVADKNKLGQGGINKKWREYMKSLISIRCDTMESVTMTGSTQVYHSSSENTEVTASVNENQLALKLNFTEPGIEIQVIFTIKDNVLSVNIPHDSIKENGINKLISVEVMPFFGAATPNEEGYLMAPDGSGMLMKYDSVTTENNLRLHTFVPYGEFTPDMNRFLELQKQVQPVLLPVYGAKNGENAFIAYAPSDEANMKINIAPAGYGVRFHRAYLEFTYRYYNNVMKSNIALKDGAISDTGQVEVASVYPDAELISKTHCINYAFLSGDDANYSGMAQEYRQYLEKNGVLTDKLGDQSVLPFQLDLLMGTSSKQMAFEQTISMTTAEQAQLIYKELIKRGVNGIQLNMMGWSKGGYGKYPIYPVPESKIGGKNGLKKLVKEAENDQVQILAQSNIFLANSDSKGFSTAKDIVKQRNSLSISDKSGKWFFTNLIGKQKLGKNLIDKLSGIGVSGISLEQPSQLFTQHYQGGIRYTRDMAMESYVKLLQTAKQHFDNIAIEAGGVFSFQFADFLFNVPQQSSGYRFSDEDIPFYQMVVHGYLPYSSEIGNLFYDKQLQKLKMIEYAAIPSYRLTYESAQKLRFSDYNELFSSQYSDYLDEITSLYQEMSSNLGNTYQLEIVSHQRKNDCVTVVYEDGSRIYINYSNQTKQIDGVSVTGMNYVVKRGNGLRE